jgi:hypothetical protein
VGCVGTTGRGRAALAGLVVYPLVVHARRLDRDGTCDGLDRARLCMSVAHDEAVPLVVQLVAMTGDVDVDLGFDGERQHAACSVAAQLVEALTEFRARGV